MDTHVQAECLCHEISGELVDVATWLAEGELNPEQFRHTVAALEARKLQRFGFHLTSAVGEGGIVHFSLRYAQNGELCASMDVDPATGKISVQRTCA